jgi:DNA-binding XRE family transcriptional regulator
MVNSEDFAKRLQKVFEYYGLTATTFSEKIEVGKATISHVLSGRNKPSLDFVLRIIKNFPEVELYWLLNGKGDFPKKPIQPDSKDRSSVLTHDKAFNNQTQNNEFTNVNNGIQSNSPSSKTISKVILCYSDGSFESFTP